MKHHISLTINEDTLLKVKAAIRTRIFRNQSQFFEIAAEQLLNNNSNQKKEAEK